MTAELLAEAIQQAVNNGLRGFTLWPRPDGRWQASVTYDGTGWRCETRGDPDTAMRAVFDVSPVSEIATDNSSIFD